MMSCLCRGVEATTEAERRTIRAVSLHNRYSALSDGERVKLKRYLLDATLLIIGADHEEDHVQGADLEDSVVVILALVCSIRKDGTILNRYVRRRHLMISDIGESEVWTNFRFRKKDLWKLFSSTSFPWKWRLPNRSLFPGETGFLLLIRRLR
ncbi:unnamed protein product [Discosporangium mesarthrocarpum]